MIAQLQSERRKGDRAHNGHPPGGCSSSHLYGVADLLVELVHAAFPELNLPDPRSG